MNRFGIAVAFVALLALSACDNGISGGGNGDISQIPGGLEQPVDLRGDPSDPTSPAYFAQQIGDRVFFSVDQAGLTSEARAILDGQASWLLRNTDVNATIEGHADEQGTREYNIALSARRAEAVRSYLVSRGVSSARLKTIPYGKERPAEICSSEECYSRNRRSVTVLRIPGIS